MSKRIALVTGGIGGIGTAICRQLAKDGCTVVANHIAQEAEKAHAWLVENRAAGYDVHIAEGDVSNFESCAAMAAKIKTEVGSVDILVNNAGITKDGVFKKMPLENWMAVININLNSVFDASSGKLVAGVVVPPLDVNGNGTIEAGEYYQTKEEAVKAISNGTYPSPPARFENLATKGKPQGLVLAFIQWILTDGQQYLDQAGYVELTPEQQTESLAKLK